MGLGGGLSFFSGTGVLGGGGLRVAKNHRRGIGWIGDVQAQHSSVTLALGSVSVDVLSVAAALAYHHEWGRLGLQVGGGLRGGAVRLSGEPTSMQAALGHSGWGAWGGVMGVANLSVIATRRLVFDLGVEVGYVFLPAAGLVSQRREVAVDGAWIGFQLGIGIFL